jgi:NAD(P)-dependent dehydrogenase (short-subunit alcohol dehydrogenase family)
MNTRAGSLDGRVAVVTGSTRGLGFSMARLLGRAGATVVLASRSPAEVADAVDRLRADGLSVARVVRTNILGTFHGSRVALPVFLSQGRGDLVNIYGQGDRGPVALQNAYASSKRWVRQFTETLQRETKGTGIRVHGMNAGLMTTELLTHVTAQAGYEERLRALPIIVGLRGQGPDAAAHPLLDLVTSDIREYRDLTPATLVTRGLRNILAGRLRRANRMPMDITVVGRRD